MSSYKFDLVLKQPSTGVEARNTMYFEMSTLWDNDNEWYEITLFSINPDDGAEIIHRETGVELATLRTRVVRWLTHRLVNMSLGDLAITSGASNGD